MNNLVIRPFEDADAEQVSSILIDCITRLCVADHNNDQSLIDAWTGNKTPENLNRTSKIKGVQFIVACMNEQISGVAASHKRGRILLNYVSPDYRNQSVSSCLLDHMEGGFAKSGLARITLDSTKTALGFYQRRGWENAGEPVVEMGLIGYPMQKALEL